MGRTAAIILAVAAGVVVLLLAAVAIVVATVDVDALVAPLTQYVKRQTGRELAIGGKPELSLSLEPRVRLRDVTLSNPPGSATPQMLAAREVDVQIALLPLLHRRIEVVRFKLVEPRIVLETDASGRGNWELGSERAAPGGSPQASAFALGTGQLEIEGGTLDYRDARSGDTTRVEIGRLFIRARNPEEPLLAQFSGRVQGVPVTLEGSAGPLSALLQQRFPLPVAVKGELAGRKLEAQGQFSSKPDATELRDVHLTFGETRIDGTISRAGSGSASTLRFALSSPLLRLQELAFPVAASGKPDAAAPKERRIFSATPVSFAALQSGNAQGTIAIKRLVIDAQRTLDDVNAKVALANGRLDVSPFTASLAGGNLEAKAVVDAPRGREPALDVTVAGRGLALEPLLATLGVRSNVKGGRTDIDATLATHGASPHAWMSDARGNLTVRVGPATLAKGDVSLPPALVELMQAMHPGTGASGVTELRCAVIRTPIAGGVARFERTVAAETSLVGMSASGTVDLGSETIDVALRPHAREVGGAGLSQLAGLVRLRGPLASPALVIDPAGSVTTIAKLGLAAGVGGLPAVMGSLLSSEAGGDECAVALGHAPARAPPKAPPPAKGASPLEEIGRALQQQLRRR